ncbi:MAG: response regulator [Planctomycetota bacterium]|nr:response regulator [Planctomycetota bacterium]
MADDEESIRSSLQEFLSGQGFQVDVATDAADAERILGRQHVDLLISDIQMPGNRDLEFIGKVVAQYPELIVIIITAHPTLPTALHSLRLRVIDYVQKPLEFPRILATIQKSLQKGTMIDCMRKFRVDCEQLESRLADMEESFSMRMDRRGAEAAAETASQVMEILFSQVVRSTLNLRLAFEVLSKTEKERVPEVSGPFCHSIDCPVRAGHEEMLKEAIRVLEKTKNSFKSKELADLRKNIESHLLNS